MRNLKKILILCSVILPGASFAYSGYWSVNNVSNHSVLINRVLAEHGDFHCYINGTESGENKSCILPPGQQANIHLTTTSSQIHEDFTLVLDGVSPTVGAEVKYECTTTTGLPAFCTDGGSHTFTTENVPNGSSIGAKAVFMVDIDHSQNIIVANSSSESISATNSSEVDGSGHFSITDLTTNHQSQSDYLVKGTQYSVNGFYLGDVDGANGHINQDDSYGKFIEFGGQSGGNYNFVISPEYNWGPISVGLYLTQGSTVNAIGIIYYYCGVSGAPTFCTAGMTHQFYVSDYLATNNYHSSYDPNINSNGTNGVWLGIAVYDSQKVIIANGNSN